MASADFCRVRRAVAVAVVGGLTADTPADLPG
jgi:hypothetical protein